MKDPFGSMQGLMSQFGNFRKNPMQMFAQKKMNIPQNIQGNPQQIIQYMMNNGTVSQEQFNAAKKMAEQVQSNPMFRQMMGGR